MKFMVNEMGISADLILFGHEGESFVDDFENVSLYEFLPEKLHQFIYETTIEIYDLEYYQELYNIPDIMITLDSSDGLILVSRATWLNWESDESINKSEYAYHVKEPVTKQVKVNAIRYSTLMYLGGYYDGVFKRTVYKSYDEKTNYPWLWSMKECDTIVLSFPDKALEYIDKYDTDLLYVNLNY